MSQDEKAREALEIFRQALDAALIQLSMNLGVKTLEQKPLWNQPKYDLAKMDWKEVYPADPQKERFETSRKCGTEDYKNLFASIQSAGGAPCMALHPRLPLCSIPKQNYRCRQPTLAAACRRDRYP